MLVLARNIGETVKIDGRITVKVLSIQGNKVKLSFDAPRDVPVHRGEVEERITGEKAGNVAPVRYTCLSCMRDFESVSERPRCRFCESSSCRKAVTK